MCHQTVCLVARHLEANGIPTVVMAGALDIVTAGRPPRATFLDYPLGHTCGRPDDPQEQLEVVRAAVSLFDEATGPGRIVTLEHRWSDGNAWKREMLDPTRGDVRETRDTTPRYQLESDRRLAEGG